MPKTTQFLQIFLLLLADEDKPQISGLLVVAMGLRPDTRFLHHFFSGWRSCGTTKPYLATPVIFFY